MKKLRENKAITLVALVITIIILLILAGISIAQLTGNGLFEKAKLAKEVSKNAQEDEDDKVKQYSNEINSYINSNRDVSEERIREIFREEIINYSSYPSGTPVVLDTWTAGGTSYTDRTITAPGDGWIVLEGISSGNTNKCLDLRVENLKTFDTINNTSGNIYKSLPCKSGVTVNYRVFGAVSSGKLTFIPMADS